MVLAKKLIFPIVSDRVDNFLNFEISKAFENSELSEIMGTSCEKKVW